MNENKYKTGCYILLNHFILSYADHVLNELGIILGKMWDKTQTTDWPLTYFSKAAEKGSYIPAVFLLLV